MRELFEHEQSQVSAAGIDGGSVVTLGGGAVAVGTGFAFAAAGAVAAPLVLAGMGGYLIGTGIMMMFE